MNVSKILVFTDCYIYGGSERLMSFLLRNETLNKKFMISLAYRNHSTYNKGMHDDYIEVDKKKLIPLNLLSNETLFYKINCKKISPLFKKLFKIPFYIIEKLGFYTIWNLSSFLFLLKKTSPELIHINNGGYPGAKSCNTLVWANKLFWRAKIIYQVNNQAMDANRFDAPFDNKIKKYTDTFLTASYLAKERLISARKFDKNKIKVISNCIIPETVILDRSQICQELSFSEKTFIITQVAFLSERKGQAYLINALYLLFSRRKDLKEIIKLVLIGDGEDGDNLKKLVGEKDLINNVYFLGYKKNSQDYIDASDLFILPSISNEDMPLVILTALQLGKPIIASNFAGIVQAIQSGENGILIDYKLESLSNNLADRIEELYSNPVLRNNLSIAAKKSFLEYTPEKYGERISELYFHILNKNADIER